MSWFFIALAAPAVWAAVNHIDKFIISKYFSGKGVGSLVMFTSLSGFIASLFIGIFRSSSLSIGISNEIIIAINGALLVASFIPYLSALENEEASFVTSLFQLIPVFGYILARIFLGETLSISQIFASAMIIVGGIIMSLDLSKEIRFKAKPFWLMMLSAFMIAVNSLVFKVVAVDGNFWGTAFWEYIGGGLFGVALFVCIKLYREQFIATINRGRFTVISTNLFAEILNIIAKLLANFASLLAPLALVWVVNGFQPFLVFIYGIILTLFIPRWGQESIDRKTLIKKISALIIIFIGVYFLLK